MKEAELIGLLESGDYVKVSRALIYIEKDLEEQPSRTLITKLVELCSDGDPNVRQEAVQAAGFYWQLPEALPVLASIMGRADEDLLVLNSAVFAIGEMAQNQSVLRGRGLSLLAHVALNESMPSMVRKNAYALALRLTGKITFDGFAKMAVSSEVVIDEEFMSSLCDDAELN